MYYQGVVQAAVNSTYQVTNTLISNTIYSTLTIISVAYSDNLNTFKCECNKYQACSSSGLANPSSTATIIAISKLSLIFANLQFL